MKIEVSREAAKEFAYFWATQATSKIKDWPQGRKAWLWAYERYDWSLADPKVIKQLKETAEMFHKLYGGGR